MQDLKFNRLVDAFIASGAMEIETRFAYSSIQNYMHELEAGITIQELKERRAADNGIFLSFDNSGKVSNSGTLQDSDIPRGSIAKLYLRGVMRLEGGLSNRGINELCQEIRNCNAHDSISGILIEANTGGGEAMAGTALMAAIQDSNIPIVVVAHQLASAGVKGTLPADRIYAIGRGSEVGSIGTMATLNKRYIEWYSENYQEIFSKNSPNKNKWWREVLQGKHGQLIKELDSNSSIFQESVAQYRPLKGDIKTTLSGGMFVAEDAIERGLIDGIRTVEGAIVELQNLIDTKTETKNEVKMTSKLINKLNSIFNLGLSEDASEEQAIQAIEGLDIKGLVNSAVNQALENNSEEVDLSGLATVAQLENVATELKGIAEKFATLEQAIEEKDAKIKELKGQIASGAAELEEDQNASLPIGESHPQSTFEIELTFGE